jgi:hypothetical protein
MAHVVPLIVKGPGLTAVPEAVKLQAEYYNVGVEGDDVILQALHPNAIPVL